MSNTLIFLLTIVITRIITLLMYGVYDEFNAVQSITYNDFFHHYYLGVILIVLYSPFKNKKKVFKYLLPIGLGLVVEEYSVILFQLGLVHFHYLSVVENVLMLMFLIVVLAIHTINITREN